MDGVIVVEIDRVSLDDLLTNNEGSDSAWKESLDDAMVSIQNLIHEILNPEISFLENVKNYNY